MEAIHSPVTADMLLQKSDDGYRHELIRGELVRMSPTGGRHGVIVQRLGQRLGTWADQSGVGIVCAAETGFRLQRDPDTVRAADAALVVQDRIPEEGIPEGFWEGAPDLAVEVLSPSDRMGDVLQKVRDYLEAGAHQVWVVDPKSRTVTVYHSFREVQVLTEHDVLEGVEILSGFVCKVQDIFQ